MFEKLRADVCRANLDLVAKGLVFETWGNASGIDRARGLVVIKPSGVPYAGMKPRQMVVVSLADGKVVEGKLKPSSDTPTHLVLYRAFKEIGGIVHTHSLYATAWAQACRDLPAYGTTQADYWHGAVPCTRKLKPAEIRNDYEANTGESIVARFGKLNAASMPAVLVAGHASFCWGPTVAAALETASILEEVAEMAYHTVVLNAEAAEISVALRNKHFERKHGKEKYYGQA